MRVVVAALIVSVLGIVASASARRCFRPPTVHSSPGYVGVLAPVGGVLAVLSFFPALLQHRRAP